MAKNVCLFARLEVLAQYCLLFEQVQEKRIMWKKIIITTRITDSSENWKEENK